MITLPLGVFSEFWQDDFTLWFWNFQLSCSFIPRENLECQLFLCDIWHCHGNGNIQIKLNFVFWTDLFRVFFLLFLTSIANWVLNAVAWRQMTSWSTRNISSCRKRGRLSIKHKMILKTQGRGSIHFPLSLYQEGCVYVRGLRWLKIWFNNCNQNRRY